MDHLWVALPEQRRQSMGRQFMSHYPVQPAPENRRAACLFSSSPLKDLLCLQPGIGPWRPLSTPSDESSTSNSRQENIGRHTLIACPCFNLPILSTTLP